MSLPIRIMLLTILATIPMAACGPKFKLFPCEDRDPKDSIETCEMNFGDVVVGARSRRILRVTNNTDEPLPIAPTQEDGEDNFLTDPSDLVEVTLAPKSEVGQTHEIPISFEPDDIKEFDGRFRFTRKIQITTEPKPRIRTRGRGVGWSARGSIALKVESLSGGRNQEDQDGDSDWTKRIDLRERLPGLNIIDRNSALVTIRNLSRDRISDAVLGVPRTPSGFQTNETELNARLDTKFRDVSFKSYEFDLSAREEMEFRVDFVPSEHREDGYMSFIHIYNVDRPGGKIFIEHITVGLIGRTVQPTEGNDHGSNQPDDDADNH